MPVFGKTEASLHISLLYRHAVLDYDNLESTPENPIIIEEQIITVLDDHKHDNFAVHHIKTLIHNYLKDKVKYKVKFLHEFTDGCSSQYKSKYCMNDIAKSFKPFGYDTQRNFFETAHAKGKQDAVGSHTKGKASLAVIRGQAYIRNAEQLYSYLKENFLIPVTANSKVTRRVIFYIRASEIERKSLNCTAIPNNQKLHSIRSNGSNTNTLSLRQRTCYCTSCMASNSDTCENLYCVDP